MDVLNNNLDFGDRAPKGEQNRTSCLNQIYSISLCLTRLKDMKLEAVDFSSKY
jgi:hypothetical protein